MSSTDPGFFSGGGAIFKKIIIANVHTLKYYIFKLKNIKVKKRAIKYMFIYIIYLRQCIDSLGNYSSREWMKGLDAIQFTKCETK